MPPARIAAQINWIAMGTRYDEWFSQFLVALLKMLEKRMLMVTAHWKQPTTAPRIHLEEHSD
jgi:hypothetical protein